MAKKNFKLPFREIIFGLEDGTVSTLGVLVGIAVGTNSQTMIILSGFVVILVESLSMAAGTFLSNKSQFQLDQLTFKHKFVKLLSSPNVSSQPLIDSFYMAISYIVGGLISLLAFFFLTSNLAIITAVFISFLFLFLVGSIKGHLTKTNPLKSGLEMMLVSTSAALVGFLVGKFASQFLNIYPT